MKLFLRVSMGCISKSFSLGLIFILAVSSSLMMAKPSFAQSNDVNDTVVPPPNGDNIPIPSIPEFTVQVVNSSNFVLIITNQPFTLLKTSMETLFNSYIMFVWTP